MHLYASSREDEMQRLPWPESVKTQFLAMQFELQHRQYSQYENVELSKIVCGTTEIGRLYVCQDKDTLRLVDITLLKEHRGRGHGSLIVRSLLVEAERRNLRLTLYVDKGSRAIALYQRLGLERVSDTGTHLFMKSTHAVATQSAH
jgi:ribosomal protein S18 acetylase RimI-like enzyme